MAVLSNTMMQGTAAISDEAGDFQIEKSLRFNPADAPYLSRQVSTSGNRKTWTIAFWIKHSEITSEYPTVFSSSKAGNTNDHFIIRFEHSNGELKVSENTGGSSSYSLESSAMHRDFSAWYHFVVAFDSTQATSTERVKIYKNGKRITAFNSPSYPAQNYESHWNESSTYSTNHVIGREAARSDYETSGYLADVYMIDGLQLGPAAFGKYDSLKIWQPTDFKFPAPNDGTTWSGQLTAKRNGSSQSVTDATKAFNGSISDAALIQCTGDDDVVNLIWTPTTAITARTLRLYLHSGSVEAPISYSINDGAFVNTRDAFTSNVTQWMDATDDLPADGEITKIEFKRDGDTESPFSCALYAIEIDGVILRDGVTDSETWDRKWTETFATSKVLLDCTASSCDDISDNNYSTSDAGSPTYQASPGTNSLGITSAISLDGQDDYIVPAAVDLNIGASAETTIDITFYLDSTYPGEEGFIYDFRTTGTGYCLYMWASNKIGIKGSSYGEITSVTEDTWHHLRIQSDKVWYDGVLTSLTPGTTAIGNSFNMGRRHTDWNGAWHYSELKIGAFRILPYKLGIAPPAGGEVCVNGVFKKEPTAEQDEVNSFHLKFNDTSRNSALGKDSLNGKIEDASAGTKPLLTTTDDYGDTLGSGFETDPNAANLVLYLPLNSANGIADKHKDVYSSSGHNNITITDGENGSYTTVNDNTQSRFYGSSRKFEGNASTGDILRFTSTSDLELTGEFCIEFWYRWAVNSTTNTVLTNYPTTNAYDLIGHGGGGKFAIYINGADPANVEESTAAGLNQWYHYAFTRQSDNKIRMWRNGVLQATSSATNTDTILPSGEAQAIGGYSDDGQNGLNGNLQEFKVYKGTAKYTAAFSPPTRNDFTVTNLTEADSSNPENIDSLVDTPTNYGTGEAGGDVRGNYCTFNPLQIGSGNTLSQGNLVSTYGSASGVVLSTIGMASGKWYAEFEITGLGGGSGNTMCGIAQAHQSLTTGLGNSGQPSIGVQPTTGTSYTYDGKGNNLTWSSSAEGDIMMIAVDIDAKKIWVGKNGTWFGSSSDSTDGNPGTGANPRFTNLNDGTYFWAAHPGASGSKVVANFGQRPFKYTNNRSGFKALCTQNLDDTFSGSELNNPSKYFTIKTYNGTGVAHDIKGVGFGPDLIWVKERDDAQDHQVYDQVRGTGKRIETNTDEGNLTQTGGVNAFLSDGWTQGDAGTMNGFGDMFVAWLWDAGTAASGANNDGSINVASGKQWVNATAGFSITEYTGTGSAATIGHGLSVPPELILTKRIDGTADWAVYHSALGAEKHLRFNESSAIEDSHYAWNDTAPTNSVFSVANASFSGDPNDYVAYCWTPILGFSAFGSYIGNNSATAGPFVYTGFRPKWILSKESSGTGGWKIWDTERNPTNPNQNPLWANITNDETGAGAGYRYDIFSNGFQVLGTSGHANNDSGDTYVYAAFAEHPLKIARAI